MKRLPSLPGGDLEYAILAAVWDSGTISGRELHTRIGAPRGLVYTTVAKVLDRLHGKGLGARQWERTAWRAVWMPVVPAAIALSMLLGWAVMEPADAEPLPAPLIGVSALFAIVWMRALARAGKASRARRSQMAAATVGLWR